MYVRLLVLLLLATPAFAAPTAYSVASLVREKDEAALAEPLREAMASSEPLVRATAARVIAVRNVTALLPEMRDMVKTEADASAAREQIRALALLGTPEDLALALEVAAKWPAGMDNALALAVARRGGPPAIDAYITKLRSTRMNNDTEFFRVALWARSDLLPFTGSRLVGARAERGWRGLLDTLRQSAIAMNGAVLASSLDSPSEDMRAASVWYLVYGYAIDPASLPEPVREKLAQPRAELSSNREDFGRELLRRMTGGEKKDDPRWLQFLDTDEADRLFVGEMEALQFLTDDEYALRYTRCEVQVRECAIPAKREKTRTIPSQNVTPAAFDLPSVLPAGLTDAILDGTRCNGSWLGVANATVNATGRVQSLDLGQVSGRSSCKRAVEVLLLLSFASNTSIRSPFTGEVLLARDGQTPLCLDEDPPDETMTALYRPGGSIQAPRALERVEPQFHESVRKSMGRNTNVLIIVEAVITKTGCVRNLRLIKQSPYPELNGAALLALSQWKFTPGYLDRKPVDVQFGLTINFKIN